MKKLLTLILFSVCSAKFSNAQYYYQPYPLSAQIASNGIEWRMECSVYDSLLGTTQYYNGPWCSEPLDLSYDGKGIASYYASNGPLNGYRGAAIYDFEISSFMPAFVDSCMGCAYANYSMGSFNGIIGGSSDGIFGTNDLVNAYYDIRVHSWRAVSFNGFNAYGGGGYSFMLKHVEDIDEGDFNFYALNPVINNWSLVMGSLASCNTPYPDYINDMVRFNDDDWCSPGGFYMFCSILRPDGIISELVFFDQSIPNYGALCNGKGVYWQDPSNNILLIHAFDMSLLDWQIDSLYGMDMASFDLRKEIFLVHDTSNTIITYGVYSFPQHVWKVSSDTLNYISSDTIINGTVHFTDSSGNSYTRGYIDSIGWGNYNTPPQPIYCLLSYNTATTGNLIYIKDYSIAADSVFIDYGDGFTTNRTFDYHLYKINDHYRSTSAANFNVCMTAYQNGVASTPSCQAVNFVTAIDEPIKQTPITILSKGNSNILNITNTNGHNLLVKVYDVAGRQIKSFNNTSNQLLVSLKTLSTGMYVVQVYDMQTHETVIGKFVKK